MATPKPLTQQENIYKQLKEIIKIADKESIVCDISLNKSTSYTLQDNNAQEFYVIPKQEMRKLIKIAKNIQIDEYLLRLKQEIHKNMPIDFEDVWCIALKEAKDYKKEPETIVKSLKRRHPYLFLSFLNNLTMPKEI